MKKVVEVLNYKELLGELASYAFTDHKALFEAIKDKHDDEEIEMDVINYVDMVGDEFNCYIVFDEVKEFLKLDDSKYKEYFYLR